MLSKSYRRGSRAGEEVRGRFDWSTDRRSLVIVDCTVGLLETILRGVPVRVGKRSRGVGMPGRARRIDKHDDFDPGTKFVAFVNGRRIVPN